MEEQETMEVGAEMLPLLIVVVVMKDIVVRIMVKEAKVIIIIHLVIMDNMVIQAQLLINTRKMVIKRNKIKKVQVTLEKEFGIMNK